MIMRTLSSELMDLSSAEDSLVSPEVADCPSPRDAYSSLHGSTLSPAKDALARLSGGSPSHPSRSSVSLESHVLRFIHAPDSEVEPLWN